MNESFFGDLAAAVDNPAPREQRARDGVALIRAARSYRWVGIGDVDEDAVTIFAYAGTPFELTGHAAARGGSGEGVQTQTTIFGDDRSSLIVVPILGAESAMVIGMLEVRSDRSHAFGPDDVGFLEECAAVVRPLYD